MPEEAFALSPINARASLPSEADYDAIREAFMETSRGRWFLSEYAKRNRNADTRMVLDAVARIEQTIAAQKQPAPTTGLLDVLGAIRAIVADAKAKASDTLSRPEGEEVFAAAREGARIIRELARTLRECGADTRICDLLNNQVSAIEAGQRQIGASGHRDAVLATFDALMLRISELADGSPAPSGRSEPPPQAAKPGSAAAPLELRAVPESRPPSVEPVARVAPRAMPEALARVAPLAKPEPLATPEPLAKAEPATPIRPTGLIETAAEIAAEQSADEVAVSAQLKQLEAAAQAASQAASHKVAAGVAEALHDAAPFDSDAAQDLVLEAVALEMAAPDFSEPELPEPEVAAFKPEQIEVIAAAPAAAPAIPAPIPTPAAPSSLGAALIARGVIARPSNATADLLAPIRRMSQAERIAFFS
jgi:hypothetical protein